MAFQSKEERIEIKKIRERLKKQYDEMVAKEIERRKEPKTAPEGVYISLQNINKIYDNFVHAVHDFNLDIKEHEFIVFVGPSGCGKSTTLRMIADLEDITTGDLFIDGVYCNDKTAKERDVAMVFQNYALYPHMTVWENMAFGLQTRGYSKEETDQRVRHAAEILQITDYLDRYPKQLSGGQMQRVALGRAIVREAKVFLMDEPLSNLDAKLRVSMRSEIIKLHARLNATTIYVTHDQTEAMTMASRIVVMKDGYIRQIGTPKEVYNNPADLFVATFIGAPAMNLVECTYDDGKLLFPNFSVQLSAEQKMLHDVFYQKCIEQTDKRISEKEYEKPDTDFLLSYKKEKFSFSKLFKKQQPLKIVTAQEKLQKLIDEKNYYENCLKQKHAMVFGIRPEDIYEKRRAYGDVKKSAALTATVNLVELLGSEYHIFLSIWGKELLMKCKAAEQIERNDSLEFVFDLNKMHIFDKFNEKAIF